MRLVACRRVCEKARARARSRRWRRKYVLKMVLFCGALRSLSAAENNKMFSFERKRRRDQFKSKLCINSYNIKMPVCTVYTVQCVLAESMQKKLQRVWSAMNVAQTYRASFVLRSPLRWCPVNLYRSRLREPFTAPHFPLASQHSALDIRHSALSVHRIYNNRVQYRV